MRFDKFTLKGQENLQIAQQLAERFGHQQIEPEHILRALMEQREGVIASILGKIGADQRQVIEELDVALDKIPKVSGAGYGQVYISPRSKAVIDKAFEEAEKMKDEYERMSGFSADETSLSLRIAIVRESGKHAELLKKIDKYIEDFYFSESRRSADKFQSVSTL